MLVTAPTITSCKGQNSDASLGSRLGAITSSSTITRCLAICAASGLVVASAGFGAVFAWDTGSQNGVLLGGLTVLMAVALEVIKPLALATALKSFRSWDLVRGTALVLLAVVAVAYSLTSELTLMAGARGDVVASRTSELRKARDAGLQRDRIEAELSSLGTTRPAATINAELNGLLSDPRVGDCLIVNGPRSQAACPKVVELRAELGKAERRDLLEGVLAEGARSYGASVGKADPGASALATYLALLNVKIDVALLTEWVVLVPVLALEFGSLLAGVVAQAVSAKANESHTESVNAEALFETERHGGSVVGHAANPGETGDYQTEREKVKKAILTQLKRSGGKVSSSQRGLSKLIGADRTTLRRAVNSLVLAGVVAMEATRNGTMLRLVA